MARVKESNRDGEASKKRTASSNASVVTPSKYIKRSGTVVRKLIKKGRKARAFEKNIEFSGNFSCCEKTTSVDLPLLPGNCIVE
jgi:hypothetical protein